MSKYTFISEQNGLKVTVELEDEQLSEIVESFKGFLLATGFHPKTVKDVLVPEDED